MNSVTCFCGHQISFENCCLPIIQQSKPADTAEQLMRSRYSAYCCDNADYLVKTHWPVKPESQLPIQQIIDSTEWLGLKIIECQQGGLTDDVGQVEFAAFFKEDGIKQLHERSNFIRKDEQWFYLNGENMPSIKLARNEICFCGSGKKFKKCHAE